MLVTMIDHTINPAIKMGDAASICYDAKRDDVSNLKRAAHCKNKGHLMILRFAYATFNIQGISRVASHQLVRVAHAGILQESQRYVEQTNIKFVTPPTLTTLSPRLYSRWVNALYETSRIYHLSIDEGMKKEDARYILPQSCTTQLNITGNMQMWRDLLNNRTKPAAQWEVRATMIEVQNLLHSICPEIFDEILVL